tara:strand:- start:3081 stop:3251 length:171 start_codon:yes stop_codon:yes gene_type:complete
MIRFCLGLFIIIGAVGADDFAMEAGTMPPPLMQTMGLCALGLALMAWALPKLTREK